MRRTKLVALAMGATALVSGPVAAAPAQAATTHPCDYAFTDPFGTPCYIAVGVYCWVFPTQTICH